MGQNFQNQQSPSPLSFAPQQQQHQASASASNNFGPGPAMPPTLNQQHFQNSQPPMPPMSNASQQHFQNNASVVPPSANNFGQFQGNPNVPPQIAMPQTAPPPPPPGPNVAGLAFQAPGFRGPPPPLPTVHSVQGFSQPSGTMAGQMPQGGQPPGPYMPSGPPGTPGGAQGVYNYQQQQPFHQGHYGQIPNQTGPPLPGSMVMGGGAPPRLGYPGGVQQPYNQQPGLIQQQQGYPGQQQQQQQQQQQYLNQPQIQQQQQQDSQPKMDLDQIPNPIEVMNFNNSKYGNGEVFETNEAGKMPPLITSDFICKDMGNANPRFIRSTCYSVPANPDILKQSKLPLALSLTPFAELRDEEREPPVTDLGELGPVRCKRCKAYMSPFMTFVDNGRKFTCPFCEDTTPVPQEYFNHLDHMGRRIDMYERAELCCGSYEFVANKDYCRNQTLPTPPAFIFMIDVSVNSVRSGLLHVLCPFIKNVILPNLPRDQATLNNDNQETAVDSELRVGFVTYDKELHFYNLKSSLAAPQMMIVSDIEEVFVPILDGFLVKLSESRSVIETLLDSLPGMFVDNKETDLMLGPVIEAGVEALKSAKIAGKLFVFHTNLPGCLAPGQLKNRDSDKKLLGSDKEKQILTAQSEYYGQLGKKCVENGCAVDLFLLPNQYCDIATLTDLVRKTSGQIYKYSFFMADTHGKRLCDDLKYAIDATIAFDAVMKVRTSTGIKPIDYLGNFSMYGSDIELAGLQRQTSLSVELKHEDKLNENSKVFVQMALLYTSLSGQRRIRIHNLSLSVCTQYSQMYSGCELDVLINYVAKLACRSIAVSTPKSIKENLIQQVAHILASYRKNCTNTPAKGQFILPETLKLLPVFVNSLLKSDVIAGAQNISVDERSWLMHRLMSMDLPSTYALFYPRLLALHDLQSTDKLPTPMRCIYERLKDNGIYLLENGIDMFLWLGANVESSHVQNLFGVPNVQQLNVEKCKLLEIDTPISTNVRAIINKINEERKSHLMLIVVRQRDSLEFTFRHHLVEDKGNTPNTSSYVEFLYHLHREIKTILS
jgi:protein transport protein SEC24